MEDGFSLSCSDFMAVLSGVEEVVESIHVLHLADLKISFCRGYIFFSQHALSGLEDDHLVDTSVACAPNS